jgi:tetratricopeptide (TPR) repeat protein
MKKRKILSIAEKHAKNGRYDQAIEEYTRIVADDPGHTRIWLKLAELYAVSDRPTLAIETYCRVAEQYASKGLEEKAIAIYTQALNIAGAPQEINLRLGALYQRQGNRCEAKKHFQAVVHHFESGPVRLAALKQLASMDPDTAEHRVSLADAYLRSGLKDKARVEYEMAAQMLRSADKEEQLVEVVKKLIKLLPNEWPQGVPVSKTLAPPTCNETDREIDLDLKIELVFEEDEPHPDDLVVEDSGLHDGAVILPPTLIDPIPDPAPLDPAPPDSLTLRSFGPPTGGEALEGRMTRPGFHASDPPHPPTGQEPKEGLAEATIKSGLHRVETCLQGNRLQEAKAILDGLTTLAPGEPVSKEIEDCLAEVYFRELNADEG